MSELELEEYDRKPFSVTAVEVTLGNIEQVAEWCKGTLDTQDTKMMGTTVKLPVIKLKGQGKDKDRVFTANIGCFVVDHKGSFRMYKPAQFHQMFNKKRQPVTRGSFSWENGSVPVNDLRPSDTDIYESAKEDVVDREIVSAVYEEQESGR